MPLYDVHIFPICQVTVSDVEADSMEEAIEKVLDYVDLRQEFPESPRTEKSNGVSVVNCGWIDRKIDSFLVDDVDDEWGEKAREFEGDGVTPAIDTRLKLAAPKLLQALKDMREGYQSMFDAMPVAWQTFDSIAEQAIKDAEG